MCVIYKYVMNNNIILIALLDDLPYHKNVVGCRSIWSETRL